MHCPVKPKTIFYFLDQINAIGCERKHNVESLNPNDMDKNFLQF